MTMRNARRVLALLLGVAGLALAAGASGAGAVTLDCTGTVVWSFSPPMTSQVVPVTATYTEDLTACTGDAAVLMPAGTSTDTVTIVGGCEGLAGQTITGSKRINWLPSGFYSIFNYTGAGASRGNFGTDIMVSGPMSAWFNGSRATEVLHMAAIGYTRCAWPVSYSTLPGTAHLTID